jgi:hypothetical protein
MNAFGGDVFGATDIVDIIGISAIDNGIARFEKWKQFVDCGVDGGCRNHEPDRTGRFKLGYEIGQGCGPYGAFVNQGVDGGLGTVKNSRFMSIAQKAKDHIGTHAAEADHAELERVLGRHFIV